MRNFKEDYKKAEAIKEAFRAAQSEGNEAGEEQARQEIKALYAEIEAAGEEYARVFYLYEEARERENERIDLHDVIWDKNIADLMRIFKENGIREFTFSSTWSSAVETAWLFTKNGCSLKGMVEINGSCKVFMGGEWEKKPAYLFTID